MSRRYRRRYGRRDGRAAALAVAAGLVLAAAAHGSIPHPGAAQASVRAPTAAAAAAIAYARDQLGKPYLWGGTGPDAYDCSGLVMEAYQSAGVSIPRTSQDQYAAGPPVPASEVQPGDLVFFAGSDGTATAPGHVGLVIGPGLMIEAYATGYPIRISAYGSPAAAPGDEYPVGFTRPSAAA